MLYYKDSEYIIQIHVSYVDIRKSYGVFMDIRQLYYFVTVAEEGQISSAAEKLNMTQPPLSQQMKKLEEDTNTKLFNRTPKGIELTEAGKLLLSRAHQILTFVSNTVNELNEYVQGAKGIVNIGIISSSVESLLSFKLPEFQKNNPKIKFNVIENDTFSILDMVEKALVDVAFVRTPFSSIGLHTYTLFSEPVCAVLSKSYLEQSTLRDKLMSSDEPLLLSDLIDEKIILLQNYENTVKTACRQFNFEPNVVCRGSNAISALLLARAGLGTMITPISTVEMTDLSDLIVRAINCSILNSSIVMVWNADRKPSYAVSKFIEHIKNLEIKSP